MVLVCSEGTRTTAKDWKTPKQGSSVALKNTYIYTDMWFSVSIVHVCSLSMYNAGCVSTTFSMQRFPMDLQPPFIPDNF